MLSRNPIWVRLKSDKYVLEDQVVGNNQFWVAEDETYNPPPADGDTFLLSFWYDDAWHEVTLTWKDTPTNANHIPVPGGAQSIDDYLETTFRAFWDEHPWYSLFLEYSWETDDSGTWWKLNYPDAPDANMWESIWFETDWITLGGFLGGDSEPYFSPWAQYSAGMMVRDDLFIVLTLQVDLGGDDWKVITKKSYKPKLTADKQEGEITVDIHQFLEPYLEDYNPYLPGGDVWGGGSGEIHNEQQCNKRFRILAAEFFDGQYNVEISDWLITDPFKVITGGLNILDYDKHGVAFGILPLYFGEVSKKWLTYRPFQREVLADTPLYLYWLCWKSRSTFEVFNLQVIVYYTDGTNSGNHTIAVDGQSQQYDTLVFNVGFEENMLHQLAPAKTAYKYEVYLETNVTQGAGDQFPVTETITFQLIPPTHLDLVILWRNSFNAIETTLLRGERKLNTDTDSEKAEQYPVFASGATISNMKLIRNNTRQSITFESGPMSADELAAHADMLRTKEIWIYPQADFNGPTSIDLDGRMRYLLRDGSFEMGYKNDNGEHINGLKFTVDFEDDENFSNLTTQWQ